MELRRVIVELAVGGTDIVKSCGERRDLLGRVAHGVSSGFGWVVLEPGVRPPWLARSEGPREKAATTVRADVVENVVHTCRAEGAFVAADTRVFGVGGQVGVAQFAVGSQGEHGILRAGGSVAWLGLRTAVRGTRVRCRRGRGKLRPDP